MDVNITRADCTLTVSAFRKIVVLVGVFFNYYAAVNAPCVGHKDDESQAQRLCLNSIC